VSRAARTEHVVTVDELRDLLAGPTPPVLLDVRWRLGEPAGDGAHRYAEAHLPGARFLDFESVLTRHTGDARDGRHPLPEVAALAESLARLGVHDGHEVVVYDEPGSFAAERAWWVLRWAGVAVRLLDGGLPAWSLTGMPVETGPDQGPPSTKPTTTPTPPTTPTTPPSPSPPLTRALTLRPGHLGTLDADGAALFPNHGTLVDARAGERFRGEVEPIDPTAGHILGAVNTPAAGLFTDDGRLPDDESLRSRLGAAGSGEAPVAVYCGSGVSAARNVLALVTLGVDAALFPGSWSAWSNDPDRPVATGP
jgi:thiosulfate/3-mercaptopyruvate sulfurtransferase